MEGPYWVVSAIQAHDGPVRCISRGLRSLEILSGSQGSCPSLRRWRVRADMTAIEPAGEPLYHDHWVTAVVVLRPDQDREICKEGCIITGCMDGRIRIFDSSYSHVGSFDGHTKGVVSLDFLPIPCGNANSTANLTRACPALISGSWDGTARIWDLESLISSGGTTGSSMHTFGPFENGVQVLASPRHVPGQFFATSTGEAVSGQPANFYIRLCTVLSPSQNSIMSSKTSCKIIEDSAHTGPIRSICGLPDGERMVTTGNDGRVVIRSAADGRSLVVAHHPLQDDHSTAIVLNCCSLEAHVGQAVVSCGEDGTVVVWGDCGECVQVIPHPGTVWCATSFVSVGGSFITGCQDGVIRVFAKGESIHDLESAEALTEVLSTEAHAARRQVGGPTEEELASATLWEQRSDVKGRKEGDVHVFNENGKLLAAQWIAGSWVIVGEVTGSNDNGGGGKMNGIRYDVVMPVEIEGPNGVRNLRLGYQHGENPFSAAIRFLDEHELPRSHTNQVADWILSHASRSRPFLGNSTSPQTDGSFQNRKSTGRGNTISGEKQFQDCISSFMAFTECPHPEKLCSKLRDLNEGYLDPVQLSSEEIEVICALMVQLCSSHAHAANITPSTFQLAMKVATEWLPEHRFVGFDILRLMVLNCSIGHAIQNSSTQLGHFLHSLHRLLKTSSPSEIDPLMAVGNQTPNSTESSYHPTTMMLALRFLANVFKSEIAIAAWEQTTPTSSAVSSMSAGVSSPTIGGRISDTLVRISLPYLTHENRFIRKAALCVVYNFVARCLVFSPSLRQPPNVNGDRKLTITSIVGRTLTMCSVEEDSVLNVKCGLQVVGTILTYEAYGIEWQGDYSKQNVTQLCDNCRTNWSTRGDHNVENLVDSVKNMIALI